MKYLLGSCQTLLSLNKHPSIEANRTQYSAPFQHNWIFRHIIVRRTNRVGGQSDIEIERRASGRIITKRVCIAYNFRNAKPSVQDNEIEFSTEEQICVIPSNMFVYALFIVWLYLCYCAHQNGKVEKKNATNWQAQYIVLKLDFENTKKTETKECSIIKSANMLRAIILYLHS